MPHPPRVRREPRRTCIGCRNEGGKTELLRVVRPPEGGDVAVDSGGKAAGRGAYVHLDETCVRRAGTTGAFARALRTRLDREQMDRLVQELLGRVGETR
jgi:predicted RNA-binding protein YlxR (DUF448 family)